MSRRSSIVSTIATQLKVIDGTGTYKTNLFNNVFDRLKFWDETNNFPCVYVVAGSETREYLPGGFAWGFLNISLKVYVKGEGQDGESQQLLLENLLEDLEAVIDSWKGVVVYDTTNNYCTSEISVTSIVTDEGLLSPYGVGELNLLVRYQVM